MHVAFIAPPLASHVRALEALASGLLDGGHRVSWIHQADVRQAAAGRTHRLPCGRPRQPPCRQPGCPGGARRASRRPARPAARHRRRGRRHRDAVREAPAVLRARRRAIVADQMEAAGGLRRRRRSGCPSCRWPARCRSTASQRMPLPVMPWGYAADERGAAAATDGSSARLRLADAPARPRHRARHAARFGLAAAQRLDDCLSPLLQLSQTTAGIRLSARGPRRAHFHHVGPLRRRADDPPLGAGRRCRAAPFVFASLGTLQGGRFGLFRAHRPGLPRARGAQLLIAHCGGLDATPGRALQRLGASWVTDFAPQRAALARADVVVTHAGLNTVLDALRGRHAACWPLPIAFDQPGVAARVVHAGAGLAAAAAAGRRARRLRRGHCAPARRAALREPRRGARRRRSTRAGGVPRAARLIERSAAASIAPCARRRRRRAAVTLSDRADLVLVGGGLANGLIAWRLHQAASRSARAAARSGQHARRQPHLVASTTATSTPAQRDWLAPLVVHRWPGHDVRLSRLRTRTLEGGYASVTSPRFDAVLRERLGDAVRLHCAVRRRVCTGGAALRRRPAARRRGDRRPRRTAVARTSRCGYQKFLGQELQLHAPHGLDRADADGRHGGAGRRLPLRLRAAARRPTRCWSRTPATPTAPSSTPTRCCAGTSPTTRPRAAGAAHAVLREEQGVLPIALPAIAEAFWDDAGGRAAVGPVRRRSSTRPPATRCRTRCALADRLALLPRSLLLRRRGMFAGDAQRTRCDTGAHTAFFRLLNRMLFLAAAPDASAGG